MEAKDRNHTHERRRLLPTVNEMMAAHNYSGTNASRSTDNLRYRDNRVWSMGPAEISAVELIYRKPRGYIKIK